MPRLSRGVEKKRPKCSGTSQQVNNRNVVALQQRLRGLIFGFMMYTSPTVTGIKNVLIQDGSISNHINL